MKIRSIIAVMASVLTVSACDGLREALTTHVDVVARAGGQELSVERAGNLLGNTTLRIPVNRETAMILADLWVHYHLLAQAAARGDSLNDPAMLDSATFAITANVRLQRFMQSVADSFEMDSASETTYNQAAGDLFVARHILFPFPGGMTQAQKDSVLQRARQIRAQVTPRNFADMARRHSSDGAESGGYLGAFTRSDMVKPFGDAIAALRPGEISQPVETQFGYHLIYRPPFAEAREDYTQAFAARAASRAESTYVASVEEGADIEVRSNAPSLARDAVADIPAHRGDDDVMATFRGGRLTVGRFVGWVESFPPQARIAQELPGAPDSVITQFVHSIARREVMLAKADSAGVVMSPEDRQQLHGEFQQLVLTYWQQLGVDPLMLSDSAQSPPERERLAAARVEAYMDRMMTGQVQPMSVASPVQAVLMDKFSWRINSAGVDRAVETASRIRESADSARAAEQPPSQVPMPGSAGGAGAPPQP